MEEIEPIKHPDEKLLPIKDKLLFKDFLEIVWKGAVGLASACYLMGFVVVNIHFHRFGYYSASLVSAQYLTAGVWAIVPMILGWFFVLYMFKDQVELFIKTPKLSVLVTLIIGTAVVFFVLVWFSEQIAMRPLWLRWVLIIVLGFFASIPTVAFFRWLSPLGSLTKEWIPLTVLLAFVSCLFTLPYLVNFSRSLYGDIPGTWGGGRPRLVRIMVKSEEKEELTVFGVNFLQGHRVSEPILLLVATDKEYILLTGKENTSVSIQSDVIQAVSYDGR